jgi:hypothetical protein
VGGGLNLRQVVEERPQLHRDPQRITLDDTARKNIGQGRTDFHFIVLVTGTVDMSVARVLDCTANGFRRAEICWRKEGEQAELETRLHQMM